MNPSRIFGSVAVLVVVLIALLSVQSLSSRAVSVVPRSTTISGGNPSNSLLLRLSVSGSVVGGRLILAVTVDEYNPTSAPLNASSARAWGLGGLRINSCYSSIYPFGVALYSGKYGSDNITSGKPVRIFPAVPCPLLIRLVTGYYFDPGSTNAVVLPGIGPRLPISGDVTISGTYGDSAGGGTAQPFTPGDYTLVAGDEWGTLLFATFRLS